MNKAEFLEKLSGLVQKAKNQESQITIDEVKTYFVKEDLTEEQMELVFDYLLAQKVVVKGYLKMDTSEAEEEKITFTDEEEAYLKEYLEDLKAFKKEEDGEKETLWDKVAWGDDLARQRLIELYLLEVVKIAKEMYHPEVFLGDLIQEGNVGLIMGIEMISGKDGAHEFIVSQIKESIQALIEEHTELKNRDKKMVEKVSLLDESITSLTEELGRKVSIDELAVYMGMDEEEILDILKLTGEETEDEKEEEA